MLLGLLLMDVTTIVAAFNSSIYSYSPSYS